MLVTPYWMNTRTDAKDALRGRLSTLLTKPTPGTTVFPDGKVPDLETVAEPYKMSMARCYGRIVVPFTIDLIAQCRIVVLSSPCILGAGLANL